MECVERTVAGRLREAMGSRSVKSVAKAAGVQPFTLRQLREGRKRGGTVETLRAVAEALGVSPGWLAFGEGAREREVVRGDG